MVFRDVNCYVSQNIDINFNQRLAMGSRHRRRSRGQRPIIVPMVGRTVNHQWLGQRKLEPKGARADPSVDLNKHLRKVPSHIWEDKTNDGLKQFREEEKLAMGIVEGKWGQPIQIRKQVAQVVKNNAKIVIPHVENESTPWIMRWSLMFLCWKWIP